MQFYVKNENKLPEKEKKVIIKANSQNKNNTWTGIKLPMLLGVYTVRLVSISK